MIGKSISHYKIIIKLDEGRIRVIDTKRKAGRVKPQSITRNSSTSGKTLILVLLNLRMPQRGGLG